MPAAGPVPRAWRQGGGSFRRLRHTATVARRSARASIHEPVVAPTMIDASTIAGFLTSS